MKRPFLPVCTLLLLMIGTSAVGCAQSRETTSATDARFIGLYEFADGSPLFVWSPEAGRVSIGFGDGETRGIVRAGDQWSYGPSLGVTTPTQGTLRFLGAADSLASTVEWTVASGPTRTARRVALRERDVTFSGRGATLAGTIIMPPGTVRGGIVFLHGSGAETRDGSRVFAYVLARAGIASLIFDKRSTGRSTGRSVSASFADLAADALGGSELLRREPGLRDLPIGLFGPSQGSWIALEVTRRSPNVAFLVLQSGDATSPLEQEMYRGSELLKRGTKLNADEIRAAVAFRRQKFLYAITGEGKDEFERALEASWQQPWFDNVGDKLPDTDFWKPNGLYDPMPALIGFAKSILAVFGARDASKDVEGNAASMREAFTRSGNARASVVVIPDANHGIFETKTGLPLERELPQLQRIAPGYLELLSDWVGKAVAPENGKPRELRPQN